MGTSMSKKYSAPCYLDRAPTSRSWPWDSSANIRNFRGLSKQTDNCLRFGTPKLDTLMFKCLMLSSEAQSSSKPEEQSQSKPETNDTTFRNDCLSSEASCSDYSLERIHAELVSELENNQKDTTQSYDLMRYKSQERNDEMHEMRLQMEYMTSMLFDLKSVMDNCLNLDSDADRAAFIIPVASRLRMPSVFRHCSAILMRGLNVDNCIRIFKLAQETQELEELVHECREFILIHFSQILGESGDLVELSFQDMMELLSSDSLVVEDEREVFDAIEAWVEADLPNRFKYITELTGTLRIPCCDTEFLLCLASNSLVADCPTVHKQIRSLLVLSKVDPESVQYLRQQKMRQTVLYKQELFIFALGGRTSCHYDEPCFETFDPSTQEWKFRRDIIDHPRGETLAVSVGREIFVLELDSERVRSFDPVTLQWRKRAPLPLHLRGVSIAVIKNLVYVMGGYSYGKVTNRCFVYNCKTDTWFNLTSMRHSRARSSATVFCGKVYCAGGRDHNHKTISYMESFDAAENQWEEETPMINSKWGHALVSCSKYLWAFGGCRTTLALKEVERFHPDSGQWMSMLPMPTARRSVSVIIFEGHFYAIGGIDRSKAMGTVEVYDPECACWKKAPNLSKARGVVGTCLHKSGNMIWRPLGRKWSQ